MIKHLEFMHWYCTSDQSIQLNPAEVYTDHSGIRQLVLTQISTSKLTRINADKKLPREL
jgi:hypothetical protein